MSRRGRANQPPRPPLGVRPVLSAVIAAGRRYWRKILPVAMAVVLVTATVDIIVTDVIDQKNAPLAISLALVSSILSLLGAVFLSGFLGKLAGVEHPPGESPSVTDVARTLPWGRLIVADLLVALIVVIGLVALIIPGLVFLILLSVTGPAIDLEGRKAVQALRRSAQLVRRYFWTSALLVLVPAIVSDLIEGLGPHPDSPGAIAGLLAFRVVTQGPIEAVLGLISVCLFVRLARLDAQAVAGPAAHCSGPAAVAEPPRAGPDARTRG
jgi:hypothetical protein